MTFFENQVRAKRKSVLLIWLYLLAVLLLVLGVYFGLMYVFWAGAGHASSTASPFSWWRPEVFGLTALGILALVGLGTAYKIFLLRRIGGEGVAEMLGGRRILANTTDAAERKILNVVEEVAIAAGVSVPPVYLLPDESINAFAAGFTMNQAVIGISRGCLRYLNRDELQGVIAHEFSHIVHGDMRLNLRLLGVLHGILLVALLGYFMLRTGMGSRRSSSRNGGGVAAYFLVGFLLYALGYIGVFFAKLIKMAVAREREFLADASAVQFTRNPLGIGGALKKIGGLMAGSRISSVSAEEASHMFFANGVRETLVGWLATHPPLTKRIQQIDPHFDGRYPLVTAMAPSDADSHAAAAQKAPPVFNKIPVLEKLPVLGGSMLAGAGQIDAAHIEQARRLLGEIPPALLAAAQEPFDAALLVFALLLDHNEEPRERQLQLLTNDLTTAQFQKTVSLLPQVLSLDPPLRLPLLEKLLPVLKQLAAVQYESFRGIVQRLIGADQQVSIFEYALHVLVLHNLDPHYRRAKAVKPLALSALQQPTAELLLALAYLGNRDAERAAAAYQMGADQLGIAVRQRAEARTKVAPTLSKFDEALRLVAQAEPLLKEKILRACEACVWADQEITVEEGELLRVIAAIMDCPLPPFLPSV